jgi:hypothetical protein
MDNIRNFFETYILPLHLKVKEGKMIYLNEEFKSEQESYFSTPFHSNLHYLNTISIENELEINSYLQSFWKDEPELQKMVPDLVELALQLKEESQEQTAELSPFLYVMF